MDRRQFLSSTVVATAAAGISQPQRATAATQVAPSDRLRLGFIGAEYKTARKILLKNLSGSSAFKNGGTEHEISE